MKSLLLTIFALSFASSSNAVELESLIQQMLNGKAVSITCSEGDVYKTVDILFTREPLGSATVTDILENDFLAFQLSSSKRFKVRSYAVDRGELAVIGTREDMNPNKTFYFNPVADIQISANPLSLLLYTYKRHPGSAFPSRNAYYYRVETMSSDNCEALVR